MWDDQGKLLYFCDGALCDRLQAFLEETLNPVEAENFRHHLSLCERCAEGLEDALQVEALMESCLEPAATRRRASVP